MALLTNEDKIRIVAEEANVSRKVAEEYLIAEEWNMFDAVYSIKADRRGGLID